jgi:hypothetical protein
MPSISRKFEVHCNAVLDEGEPSTYLSGTETGLQKVVGEVDALIAGRDAVFFPKSQRNAMVNRHRLKSRFRR